MTVLGGGVGQLSVRLDPVSGLPLEVGDLPVRTSVTLRTEGDEVFVHPHSLGYVDTVDVTAFTLVEGSLRHRADGVADVCTVRTSCAGWEACWEYTFRSRHPRVGVAVELSPAGDGGVVRDLRVELAFLLPEPSGWSVEAPGNQLRPGVPLTELAGGAVLSTAGGTRGSSGLVAAHDQSRTLVLWPFCRTEIGLTTVGYDGTGLLLTVDTGVAGRLGHADVLRYETVYIDLVDATWPQVRDAVPSWYQLLGLAGATDGPRWASTASMFEVQVGYSVFRGGYRYSPYPDVRALHADLDRIQSLGYDVVQVMPRQPYPSYNVHDYADVTTTYGDEDDLRAFVDACHSRGVKVILDILMHGVIDKEVMRRTADRVRSGPYSGRLDEGSTLFWGAHETAADAVDIAWSRHIIDFEPYWSDGSPARHPLVDEHPEWFMRDSAQDVVGVYTNAFDVANPSWQEYFCAAAEDLVRRLDVDGFRFDAPTYNALPNWSEATERRASYSPLGCLSLFDELRTRLRRLKPSVLMYTEPSGVLFHQAMDVTYNYDEQWLIPAVLGGAAGAGGVRDAAELAGWFRDRNALLPPGSVVAHHIDSHDTFWWPLPGEKWRREQFGTEATRALLAVFALSGGAYMTFVGGETGIEDDVRRVHSLRSSLPELAHGAADYHAVSVSSPDVYAVARVLGGRCTVVLVNLSDAPVTASCTVGFAGAWTDVWSSTSLPAGEPVPFSPYQVRVVTVRQGDE